MKRVFRHNLTHPQHVMKRVFRDNLTHPQHVMKRVFRDNFSTLPFLSTLSVF